MATIFGKYTPSEMEEEETENLNKPPLFHVFAKPTTAYTGDFGFDWMRLGDKTLELDGQDYSVSSKDFTLLESKYESLTILSGQKYYTPWLCMFPNHKDIIGKDVELLIRANVDDIAIEYELDDIIRLVPSNDNIKVTPDTVTLTQISTNIGTTVKIECLAPLTANASIVLKLESALLDKPEGTMVGKINIVKNSDHAKYKIDVYPVFNAIKDDPQFGQDKLEAKFTNDKLTELEAYLNTRSLNQALIQVKFKYKTDGNPYNLYFPKNHITRANEGKNSHTGAISDEYAYFVGLITDAAKMEVESTRYTLFCGNEYKRLNIPKRGIYLFISTMDAKDAGGGSFVVPKTNQFCILFASNWNNLPTYSHELGHVLGLYHTFLKFNTLEDDRTQEVRYYQTALNELNQEKARIDQHIATNSNYYTLHRAKKDELLSPIITERTRLNRMINETRETIDNNKVRFEKRKTLNIMDYSTERTMFMKYQWEIMQKETIDYYNRR